MGEAGNNKDADLGFESQLWRAADALRSNMDAAEYKHVVRVRLGMLKCETRFVSASNG